MPHYSELAAFNQGVDVEVSYTVSFLSQLSLRAAKERYVYPFRDRRSLRVKL